MGQTRKVQFFQIIAANTVDETLKIVSRTKGILMDVFSGNHASVLSKMSNSDGHIEMSPQEYLEDLRTPPVFISPSKSDRIAFHQHRTSLTTKPLKFDILAGKGTLLQNFVGKPCFSVTDEEVNTGVQEDLSAILVPEYNHDVLLTTSPTSIKREIEFSLDQAAFSKQDVDKTDIPPSLKVSHNSNEIAVNLDGSKSLQKADFVVSSDPISWCDNGFTGSIDGECFLQKKAIYCFLSYTSN